MRVLARKIQSFGLLKTQMIIGAITMFLVVGMIPLTIVIADPTVLLDPFVLCIAIAGMLLFGLFGYFLFIRPCLIYRKLPDVLVEADGEYLYIHGEKEAKIPFPDLDGTTTFVHLPFLFSNERVGVLFTHLVSERYGDIDVDVPGYGSFKLRFVSNVQQTADELLVFMNFVLNS